MVTTLDVAVSVAGADSETVATIGLRASSDPSFTTSALSDALSDAVGATGAAFRLPRSGVLEVSVA